MKLKTLLLASASAVLMAAPAFAADVTMYTDPGFDWDGLYAGVIAGGETDFAGDNYGTIGGEVGALFSIDDNFVIGVSGALEAYFGGGGNGTELEGVARFGYAPDDFMIFASGGFGLEDFSTPYYVYGGGLWFAVSDDVSVRGEVLTYNYLGSVTPDYVTGTVGAFWHFQ